MANVFYTAVIWCRVSNIREYCNVYAHSIGYVIWCQTYTEPHLYCGGGDTFARGYEILQKKKNVNERKELTKYTQIQMLNRKKERKKKECMLNVLLIVRHIYYSKDLCKIELKSSFIHMLFHFTMPPVCAAHGTHIYIYTHFCRSHRFVFKHLLLSKQTNNTHIVQIRNETKEMYF